MISRILDKSLEEFLSSFNYEIDHEDIEKIDDCSVIPFVNGKGFRVYLKKQKAPWDYKVRKKMHNKDEFYDIIEDYFKPRGFFMEKSIYVPSRFMGLKPMELSGTLYQFIGTNDPFKE